MSEDETPLPDGEEIHPKSDESLGGGGALSETDLRDFSQASQRVYRLLADGDWHSANAIRNAAGEDGRPASEGLRRMRDLRPMLNKYGFEIDKAAGGGRLYFYRIVVKEQSDE